MNIHDQIEARCNNMSEDTPGVIPYCDPATLAVGRDNSSKLFFYKRDGGTAVHSYWVEKFPAHRERMIYTLSQMLQSQQKALKLVTFIEEMHCPSVYSAASILADEPERIKEA